MRFLSLEERHQVVIPLKRVEEALLRALEHVPCARRVSMRRFIRMASEAELAVRAAYGVVLDIPHRLLHEVGVWLGQPQGIKVVARAQDRTDRVLGAQHTSI